MSFITSSMMPLCRRACRKSDSDRGRCVGPRSSPSVSANTSLILPWISIWHLEGTEEALTFHYTDFPPRNLLIAFLLSLNIVIKSMLNEIYITERLSYRTVFFNLLAIDAFLLLLPPDGNCYRKNTKILSDDITQTLHTLSFDERWSVLCCIKYSASCLPIWQKTGSYVLIGSFVTLPWRKPFDKRYSMRWHSYSHSLILNKLH